MTEVENVGNDIKILTEYKTNDKGEKIKVTRKVRLKSVKHHAKHSIAERSRLSKFGEASKSKSSFDDGTTMLMEETRLNLLTVKDIRAGLSFSDGKIVGGTTESVKKPTAAAIQCRTCKGDHWTTKCPYKATLGPLEELLDKAKLDDSTGADDGSKTSASKPDKYVPPSLRNRGAGGSSESLPSGSKRFGDENPSLRVTNLSEDTTEEDLHMLFSRFGPLSRCFLARERDTGRCKGFAFISYRSQADAERALERMNGHRFANLILNVEWSTPK